MRKKTFRTLLAVLLLGCTVVCVTPLWGQNVDTTTDVLTATDTLTASDSLLMTELSEELPSPEDLLSEEIIAQQQQQTDGGNGLHDQLKSKFVEGSASFMSLVAIVLVLGLALCIERIIYLTLAEVNAKKLLTDVEKKVEADDMEGIRGCCMPTRIWLRWSATS